MKSSYLSLDDVQIFHSKLELLLNLWWILQGFVFLKCIFDSSFSIFSTKNCQYLRLIWETFTIKGCMRLTWSCMNWISLILWVDFCTNLKLLIYLPFLPSLFLSFHYSWTSIVARERKIKNLRENFDFFKNP